MYGMLAVLQPLTCKSAVFICTQSKTSVRLIAMVQKQQLGKDEGSPEIAMAHTSQHLLKTC